MASKSGLVASPVFESTSVTLTDGESMPLPRALKEAVSIEQSETSDHIQQGGSASLRRAAVLIAMSFLWTASQIPLFFFGGITPRILASIGGYDRAIWIALGNLIPLGIVTPFVGAMSDLFGRKIIGMAAFILIIIGSILCATATSTNPFIAGSVLMGIGAGFGELIALAVAGEIAPAEKRGFYVAVIVLSIVPFCPAVFYAELLSYVSTWRYVGLLIGVWSFVGLAITIFFYKPPRRRTDVKRRELAKRIDFVGGVISGAGLTLFLVGLSFAAEGYRRTDPVVLAPFIFGVVLILLFALWETRYAKWPMFPSRLKEKSRLLFIVLLITFVSGANFFAVLVFWPTQYANVYATDSPVSQGIGSLPVGFGIIVGSIVATYLVSVLKGRVHLLMTACAVLMTTANGAMAYARVDNLNVMWPIVTFACFGVGAVIVPSQVVAGIICPQDLIATVTALTISLRVIGGAIAYAVYYNIFTAKFTDLVPLIIAPVALDLGLNSTKQIEAIAELLREGAFALLLEVPGITNQTQVEVLTNAGRAALSLSYAQVYYVSIAFGVTAIIASFFLNGVEQEIMTTGPAVNI